MTDNSNDHLPKPGTPTHFRVIHNQYKAEQISADEAFRLLSADFADMRKGHELMQGAVRAKQIHPSPSDEASFREIYHLYVGFLDAVTKASALRQNHSEGIASLSLLRSVTTRQQLGIN